MRGVEPGDSLVFYFSGHGLRQRGLHGDEIDGFDETICPLDFQTNGMILDNYINRTLVQPLIKGVTLHGIVDSCHSGTVLDLPLVYNVNTWVNFFSLFLFPFLFVILKCLYVFRLESDENGTIIFLQMVIRIRVQVVERLSALVLVKIINRLQIHQFSDLVFPLITVFGIIKFWLMQNDCDFCRLSPPKRT